MDVVFEGEVPRESEIAGIQCRSYTLLQQQYKYIGKNPQTLFRVYKVTHPLIGLL